MRMHRLMIAGFVVAACLAIDAAAQVEAGKAKAKDKGRMQSASTTVLTDPLESAETVAKLKLTVAQKPAVDKLLKEFDTKLKELVAKTPVEKAPAPSKFAKFKGKGKGDGAGTASAAIGPAIELRDEYGEKFAALLTEPQKKTLDDIHLKMGEALLLGGNKK